MQVDLTEAEAALAEEAGEPHVITMFGETWTIPPVMPPFYAVLLARNDSIGAMESLLGTDQAQRFIAHAPSSEHLRLFAETVYELTGTSSGKSQRSASSSKGTGKPSKRTSKGSTTET